MKIEGKKRGQVTIFIIISIVIVALGILVYLFVPGIQTGFGVSTNNPNVFIQNCMEDKITETVEMISTQGGSMNPEHVYLYQNQNVEYLCYTSEYYVPCVMQQPLLKSHIESEIKKAIAGEKESCLNSLKDNFESQGYDVNINSGETNVEILPKRIIIEFNNSLTLTKGEAERYDKLVVSLNNNLYELVSIANSILNMEARYGDSETTTYMNYYHNLKVEKDKQGDGTTIYTLTERDTGNKFRFASRSIAWPPGIKQ
ncbi:hypothetical protein COU59_01090 [Candidatus Pacearchaeota archaeon CG10_big_fil_rev_8_21_14_0_10_34_12]|nr:MAG: hypothetical protein COU59_01090 [Candidatus Pacearchaeota archaeon CG10_big_fil_rev_8_21_14_0_10_34_12]